MYIYVLKQNVPTITNSIPWLFVMQKCVNISRMFYVMVLAQYRLCKHSGKMPQETISVEPNRYQVLADKWWWWYSANSGLVIIIYMKEDLNCLTKTLCHPFIFFWMNNNKRRLGSISNTLEEWWSSYRYAVHVVFLSSNTTNICILKR